MAYLGEEKESSCLLLVLEIHVLPLLRCHMNDWKGDVRVIITARVPKERKNPFCYFVLFWIMFRKMHHFTTVAKVFPASYQSAAYSWIHAHPDHAGPPWRPPTHSEKTVVFETLLWWKVKQSRETADPFRFARGQHWNKNCIIFFFHSQMNYKKIKQWVWFLDLVRCLQSLIFPIISFIKHTSNSDTHISRRNL